MKGDLNGSRSRRYRVWFKVGDRRWSAVVSANTRQAAERRARDLARRVSPKLTPLSGPYFLFYTALATFDPVGADAWPTETGRVGEAKP